MYSETTRSITVTVKPFYLGTNSSPAENRYVWAYHVRIENRGGETVQLRRRHWKITDNRGHMEEVARRRASSASSRCSRPAKPSNIQRARRCRRRQASWWASYEMETGGGDSFWVRIPAFSLDSPHQSVRLN